MKAKNLINQLTKLGFYIVDDKFFNEDELEQYGVCTLQNDNNRNIDYIDITYDDYEILGDVGIGINGKNKLVKPSKLIDVLKLYESRKSARKSLTEKDDTIFAKDIKRWMLSGKDINITFKNGDELVGAVDEHRKDSDDKNAECFLCEDLTADYTSQWFIVEIYNGKISEIKFQSYDWLENYMDKNDYELVESKKSTHKSIKESRGTILDNEFYKLFDEGYIYDEDENGMNMSYGEYAEIDDDLWEVLENEVKKYRDFQSAYDAVKDIIDNTGDDALMFMSGIDDFNDFYFEIDEDEGTYRIDGKVPPILSKLFDKFKKETDFVEAD